MGMDLDGRADHYRLGGRRYDLPVFKGSAEAKGLITRKMLIERANITEPALRVIEKQCTDVHPDAKNDRGWAFYKKERVPEVRELAKKYIDLIREHELERVNEAKAALTNLNKATANPKDAKRSAFRPTSSYTPEEAAKVFRMLTEGAALTDVVIKLVIDPVIVEELAEKFISFSKALAIPAAEMDRFRKLIPEKKIESVEDLYQALRFALKRTLCPRCREKERAPECIACLCAVAERQAKGETVKDAPPIEDAAE